MLIASLAAFSLLFQPGPAGTAWGQLRRVEGGAVIWQTRVPNIKLTAIVNDLGVFYQGCQPGDLDTCEVDWIASDTGKSLGIYNGDILTYGQTFTLISDRRVEGFRDIEWADSTALTTSGRLRFAGTMTFTEACPQPSHFTWVFENPDLLVKATTGCGVQTFRFHPTTTRP